MEEDGVRAKDGSGKIVEPALDCEGSDEFIGMITEPVGAGES